MDIASSPVADYGSFAEVINETKDVYVVDLVRFTNRLSKDYLSCLEREPAGIYIRGALEPLIVFGGQNVYYTLSQWQAKRHVPNIYSFEAFTQANEPIVDQIGKIICQSPRQMQGYFQEHCSFNYSAVHLAAVAIWDVLRSLHRDTRPCSRLPQHWLTDTHWVLKDQLETFYGSSQPDLISLIDQVWNFIGRDHCAIYTMDMQNTTLRIGKGNDFRVIAYYENIFNQYEAERFQTHGY